MTVPYLHNINS